MSIGKWILGGLGFAVGGPIGALIGVLIGSAFDSVAHNADNGTSRQDTSRASQRSTQGDISVSIIVLLACVIKADGRVLKSEINFIKPFLLHQESLGTTIIVGFFAWAKENKAIPTKKTESNIFLFITRRIVRGG
mgnify:CR=1 FL=1